MKQFNRMIYGAVILWIALVAVFLIGTNLDSTPRKGKEYLVEVNRIQEQLIQKGEFQEINLSLYKYVKQVDYLQTELPPVKENLKQENNQNIQLQNPSKDNTVDKDNDVTIQGSDDAADGFVIYVNPFQNSVYISSFFEGKEIKIMGIPSVPKNLEYIIRPFYLDNVLKGYLRYSYRNEDKGNIFSGIWMPVIILFLSFLFTLGLLVYIKRNIINPFHEISELPYELSKGHLPKALKENKNRYFGKFLWGLDLLRENLEEHKRKELQMEKDKKLMILSISHDIKTPLSTIKLYSKALYEDLYDTEEKRHLTARNIEDKVDQIENFVEEIIKTSSTDLFEFNIKPEDFYLSKLMKAIQKTYEEKLKLLKIEFTIHPYLDKMLNGDQDKLIDVFDNLLQNAIKYGDGKKITIDFEEEDNCQLIRVTNTGTPLPTTDFIHMFESFWRGANAYEKQGNGLGLYICKQILLKMGGEIFAEARENEMSLVMVIRKS